MSARYPASDDTTAGHYEPKEHQGGAPRVAKLEVTEWDNTAFDVAIEPEYPQDKLVDQAREAISRGEKAFSAWLERQVAERCEEVRSAAVASVLAHISGSSTPLLTLDELIYASGVNVLERVTAVSLARKHGISKQAFSAGVRRTRAAIGLRKSVEMRDEKAREHMRMRNKRQNKPEK